MRVCKSESCLSAGYIAKSSTYEDARTPINKVGMISWMASIKWVPLNDEQFDKNSLEYTPDICTTVCEKSTRKSNLRELIQEAHREVKNESQGSLVVNLFPPKLCTQISQPSGGAA